MNIEVSTVESVTASECISCNECVNVCPAIGALEVKARTGRSMSTLGMTGIVVGVLAVIMALATAAGAFAWQMPSLKEAIEQTGGISGSGQGEGAGEGTAAIEAPAAASGFDTSVIKGYMSMREISEATGVPENLFVEKWGVPEADLGKPMKEIKDQYGFEPDDVKIWVGEQLAK